MEDIVPYQVLYDYSDVPTVKKFTLDNTRQRCIMGCFGSGKTSGCIMDIIRRAHEQTPSPDGIRRSRWAVVRNSYRQLCDTTIRSFHDWFPPKIFGEYRVTDHNYFITKFPNIHLEICFRALDREDQISNLLSFEFTGAWFNEVREIPWTIIDAMDGRIGRYPSKRDVGEFWHGIIMDTNPPDEDSILYKKAEILKPDNFKIFKQPSGLSIHAENTKHLPKNYYQNLAKGKDEMFKRVYIHGQYGYLVSGKPVFGSFKDNIHVSPKILEPMKGVDVLIGMDFGLCYDDKTEVLTESGWKLFKDVTNDDLIMTKNFETNIIEYHKPQKRIARKYHGNMYLYENHNVNFCVTPEHIIPCRKRYGKDGKIFNGDHRITTENLYKNVTKHYAVDIRAKWEGNSDGLFGPLQWTSSVFSEFMGLYLSEGSCDRVNSRITIAQDKENEVFQKILNNTGLDWIRSSKRWRVTNNKLNKYLLSFGYSHEKRVPFEIKKMKSEDILKFIFSYTRGDGHIRIRKNGVEEHTIFTVSRNMADDFQELALKVGWHAKIRIVKPQDSVIFENGKGRVIHNDGGYSITFKKKKGTYSEIVKKDFSIIPYSGMVYCLTVPNGTLYTRRMLTPSWNGNSPAITIGQITPFGQLRILDELVSDGMGIKQFCLNQLFPLLQKKYFGMNIMGYGDPSGSSRAPTDETTCFEVLHSMGLSNIQPAPTNAIIPRVGAVETYLNKMIDGEPGFVLSPNCRYLRKAMNGAYHYDKDPKSTGEEYKPMPVKNFASHVCFSGDTLVLTPNGEKRIDEIKAGDNVVTPFGNRKVLASGLTKKDAKVIEIVLSNGKKIICTENHEFVLANKSIVKSNALRYTDVLQNYQSWRTLKWSIQSLLNFKARNIGFRQGIITGQKIGKKGKPVIFTELFGNIIMNVKSLMDMIYTMLTTTLSITIFPIWNLFIPQTTPDTTLKNELKKELSITKHHYFLQENQQKSGIHLQKELSGIKNMEKKYGKIERCLSSFVNIVVKKLRPRSQQEKNSVISTAKLEQDTIAEKTTFKESVSFVVQTLRQINITKLRRAPKIVQISQCSETENVYNLTVDIDHVFYANGVLSCNCDSLEYLCLYLDEKENYDKQRKSFLAQMNKKSYVPASSITGY